MAKSIELKATLPLAAFSDQSFVIVSVLQPRTFSSRFICYVSLEKKADAKQCTTGELAEYTWKKNYGSSLRTSALSSSEL